MSETGRRAHDGNLKNLCCEGENDGVKVVPNQNKGAHVIFLISVTVYEEDSGISCLEESQS